MRRRGEGGKEGKWTSLGQESLFSSVYGKDYLTKVEASKRKRELESKLIISEL